MKKTRNKGLQIRDKFIWIGVSDPASPITSDSIRLILQYSGLFVGANNINYEHIKFRGKVE